MPLLEIPELNTRTGTLRAYHLAAIVFISSFLAGYDSGVAGGVLTYKSFQADFKFKSSTESEVSSLTIGLEQLGSFLSCFFVYPLTNKYGRKYVIAASALVFVVGAVIQTIKTGSLAGWYVGRIVAGIGMGGLSIVVPMYTAEMTPKEIRGRCGSFYQWMYTWGVFAAYWIDYGVAASGSIAGTSREWQIPVGLQIVSSGILFLGMFSLPESVRWLLSNHRSDEAWKSLTWIRGDEGEKTLAEFNETQFGLKAEKSATDNFTIRELWHPSNRLRFIIGPSMFIFQNTTGSSALAVFAPQYFKLIVGNSGNRDLLLTGLFGAVKVIGCTFFIWVLAERFSRRGLLMGGASLMALCMLIITLIVKYIPTQSTGSVTNAGRATVAMIYLDIIIYNCSWGPVPWAYVPEIFPTRIRALGLAFSMLAHWASSFCFSFSSPYMISNIGEYTFLIFMGFDLLATVFTYFFAQETRGKNLEAAAGTEWEVAEKDVAPEGTAELGEAVVAGTGDTILAEGEGRVVTVVAAHDTFGSGLKGIGLKHRS